MSPKKIIEISTANMNILPSKKYKFSPEEVEKKSIENEKFKTVYNMHRLEKTNKLKIKQDRYDKKRYEKKRKKLRENLAIGEKVYVLAERIKKKSAPGKFYKQSVQNTSYFNKETIFTIHRKKVIDNIMYYWIKTSLAKLSKRFSRSERFALKHNFM